MTTPRPVALSSRRPLAILTAILLTAAALRLVGIAAHSPPGLSHDEVANWLIDRSILDAGNHALYFTQAYGHEAGFHYVQAGFVALLGDNALALRLPAAFFSLLLIPITYALTRKLFGQSTALAAAALLAVLFWPIFYARQALRANSLPVLSGLSAYFWWKFWEMDAGAEAQRRRKDNMPDAAPPILRSPAFFAALSGLCAALSLYTYMAARAVPIFYAAFIIYLAQFHRAALRRRWRQVALFSGVFVVVAAPITLFLLTTPGAEYRLGEVNAPLQALLAGDFGPVLQNSWRILGMAIVNGDPLWRQNVAGRPVFDPLLAAFFYLSIGFSLWRVRDSRYAFLILWLLTAITPSLVTIDAPSTIRMVNTLPILTIFPALVMHNRRKLSTVFPNLSTEWWQKGLSTLMTLAILYHIGWTIAGIFWQWPANDEVQFVWQGAFADIAAYIDKQPDIQQVALAGWTPDTMDAPSFNLMQQRTDTAVSHFSPRDGTLILPAAAPAHLFRPAVLPLDPFYESLLAASVITQTATFTHYTTTVTPPAPQIAADAVFGDELAFLGISVLPDGRFLSHWRILAVPQNGRRLFLHYLDANDNILAEDYHLDTADPQNLFQPHWQVSDTLLQLHPPAPAGTVTLRLGWFDPYTCPACQNLLTATGEPFIHIPLE